LKSSSKSNAINIISKIASIGIVVSATVLFIFLSIFSGLKDFSLSFSNDFDPDLKIFPKTGKSFLLTEEEKQKMLAISDISFFSRIIEEKVLFLYNSKEQVAYIKGVDKLYNHVNNVNTTLYSGQWLEQKSNQVVLGNSICQKLNLGLFDRDVPLEVFVPKAGKGSLTNAKSSFNKSYIDPVGIYAINEELDSKFVFADLQLTQDLLEFKSNQITGIEIKLAEDANQDAIIDKLNVIFDNKVEVKTREALNDSLHKMLNTENTVIYLIFTLVIILTLFTLAGAIIMMIIDKRSNLKTLLNLGAPLRDLKNIFLYEGILLSFFGGIFGLILGTILILIQQFFNLVMITETLAYPVRFDWQNVVIVFFTITALGVLASLIASSRVTAKLLE
jgi:lipoprotein-releasing system permease protein